jgi:hypothetical protein
MDPLSICAATLTFYAAAWELKHFIEARRAGDAEQLVAEVQQKCRDMVGELKQATHRLLDLDQVLGNQWPNYTYHRNQLRCHIILLRDEIQQVRRALEPSEAASNIVGRFSRNKNPNVKRVEAAKKSLEHECLQFHKLLQHLTE